jgi:phosphatidate cytidylyltransferase
VFFGLGIGLALGLIIVILSSLRLNPLESTDKRWILVKVVSVYIALCTSSFIMFKLYVPSPWIVLCFWLSLWVFDSTAYLWGRNTGSERFAPFISPGKNLEGFVFGYITTILCSALLSVIFKQPIINMFGIFVPLSGICGDLLESWAKRIAGVKDSGKIIPYHGGIWDRFDSSLLASLVVLVVIECL